MTPDEPHGNDSGSRLASSSNLLGLGWQIASTLIVFTGLGYALDRWLDTLPWFLIAGSFFGLVGVFVQVFRIAAALDEVEKKKKARSTERKLRNGATEERTEL